MLVGSVKCGLLQWTPYYGVHCSNHIAEYLAALGSLEESDGRGQSKANVCSLLKLDTWVGLLAWFVIILIFISYPNNIIIYFLFSPTIQHNEKRLKRIGLHGELWRCAMGNHGVLSTPRSVAIVRARSKSFIAHAQIQGMAEWVLRPCLLMFVVNQISKAQILLTDETHHFRGAVT